jgi:hypothetical protein
MMPQFVLVETSRRDVDWCTIHGSGKTSPLQEKAVSCMVKLLTNCGMTFLYHPESDKDLGQCLIEEREAHVLIF